PCSFWYRLQLYLYKPRVIPEKKYSVSICAIFKNEALYLREWIEFHKIVGIKHFYLYNNNSEDNYIDVLDPYIKSGIVTLIQWPQNQAQMQAYHHSIENFSTESEWLTFIDIDEFIVPNSTDSVYDFLKPFQKNRPVVIAYWKMFGTSGRIKRDLHSLVIEDFTICWEKYTNIGKLFFNTAYIFNNDCKRNKDMHSMWGNYNGKDLVPVNIFNKPYIFGKNIVPFGIDNFCFPLQINHYFTKSYDEYQYKKLRG
ncbi:glycosyltransferase family 92 protein, partial [Treponema pedis]|uniref:glycosyltransferase family 92 protein n=1 Tax=Treponema pedis TaxID=409322 RepID=UPI0004651F46